MTTSSSLSNPPHRNLLGRLTSSLLASATIVSVGGYLLSSAIVYRIGFPLDDSWIHQTFARNLAQYGEWSFIPGQLSGGSTAPLWSALLAIGFLIHLSPYIWTYLLGGFLLFALAVQTEIAIRSNIVEYRGVIPWAGLLVIFEWHLVWASASGMETLLHALLILAVLVSLLGKSPRWTFLGLLAGVSVWVRPDGLTLLGPILLTAICTASKARERFRVALSILVGFGSLFLPYILFNLLVSKTALPTTFYAKQAEYVAWQNRPLLGRIGEILLQFLTGPAIVLLPGFIKTGIEAFRRKDWGRISIIVWILGYVSLYLLRLPAYQHGRYLMPAMPAYFLLGLEGSFRFIYSVHQKSQRINFLKTAWVMTLALVGLGFWILGMRSYDQDVRYIESEMVDTAKWAAHNLPENSLLAVHDIGAMGYYGNHRLVDLAGLVSPEVISFIRDDAQITLYLNSRKVEYLVVFPDWYPSLVSGLLPVYSTNSSFAGSIGATNMTIYRWPQP